LAGNFAKLLATISLGRKHGADLLLFSELTLTGYPPADLLLLPHFIEDTFTYLERVIAASRDIAMVVGLPRRNPAEGEKGLLNSAAIIADGHLLGFHDKLLLPTYDVFDERRYFDSAEAITSWQLAGQKIGVTICEDIWQHSALLTEARYPFDPVLQLKQLPLDLLLNLSASPYSSLKGALRYEVCRQVARTLCCPLVLCNQVGGNDSLIFDGHSLAVDNRGALIAYGVGFAEQHLLVETTQPGSVCATASDAIGELYQALVMGVRDYFAKSGFARGCLGLSGGIDSAVVACIAAEALGACQLLGVCMPSRYSSPSSVDDAVALAKALGITTRTIPIEGPFQSFLELLQPAFEGKNGDATEENLQARIRGMILMALSNKHGYLVLSTGNKSELAVGYSTLYGDMCGGLGVISDLTKRQVYALAAWINREREIIPKSTILKPPSAELRPNQRDSDSLPDYDIVDNVVETYVERHLSADEIARLFGYPLAIVEGLIQKIHRNEYKRRQAPPGLRVTEKAFTAGRNFPIVQRYV
jgi:NAD+ synthase (glutamine-hydrolysing)